MDSAMEAACRAADNQFGGLSHRESYMISVAITAYLAAKEAAGFVMVPVEPTEAMLEAGWSGDFILSERAEKDELARVYRDMLIAAAQEGE